MSFELSINTLKLSDLPPEDEILTAGRNLMEATKSWKPGKAFHKRTVQTFYCPKKPGEHANWYCRVSIHGKEDATFEEFWSKLGVDKAENEQRYVHDIDHVSLLKELSPTQAVWSMHYKFNPPVSPRIFTVLHTLHRTETSPKTGIIISIPIDPTGDAELEKADLKGVKGRYCSIEQITELEDGRVEWRMATSSTPGGNIPQFLADTSIPRLISDDVPAFIKFYHNLPAADKPASQSH